MFSHLGALWRHVTPRHKHQSWVGAARHTYFNLTSIKNYASSLGMYWFLGNYVMYTYQKAVKVELIIVCYYNDFYLVRYRSYT